MSRVRHVASAVKGSEAQAAAVSKRPKHVQPAGSPGKGGSGGSFVEHVQKAGCKLVVPIEVQGQVIECGVIGQDQRGGGKRGIVEGFSPGSRKRYLMACERLVYKRDGLRYGWTFVTLTYPDGMAGTHHGPTAARDLEVWWKRLTRHFPRVGAIYVKELQPERRAIHFHLLYYGPYLPHTLVAQWWSEVIGYEGKAVCWVERVQSWKAALKYCVKYMGKPAPEASPTDQRDSAGGDAEADEDGVLPCSLDTLTYSAGLGRWWGMMGREFLPWGELTSTVLEMGQWFYRWRRCARRVYGRVSKDYKRGFTLVRGDPMQWLTLAEWFQAQEVGVA